jgi:ribonuclease VapC
LSVVIDASALLAVLLGETGADFVVDVLRGSRLSTVNLSECLGRVVDKGHAALELEAIVRSFEIEMVPFSSEHARQAAELRPASKHLGLSLGDRACLALAMQGRRPLLTGDRRLASFACDVDIRMIR